MRRGLRYLPVPPKGRRRIVVLAAGLLAAMSLVWQQQATLASFTDTEVARASFKAAELTSITPEFTTTAATVTGTWPAASGSWATPNYVLTGATTSSGGNAAQLYSGPARNYTQTTGSAPTTGNLKLSDISAGGTHACGIARGELYCWGTSSTGALGLGGTTATNTPTKVGGGLAGKTVTAVSAGASHTCAVADGRVYCWGSQSNGRLGNGQTSSNLTVPASNPISGAMGTRTATDISAGSSHSCAVADGLAFCWGDNTNGRVGDGGTTQRTSPVAVTASGVLSGRTLSAISAGTAHSCAVADGLAFCWGLNTNGRLGNSSTTQSTSPVAVTTSGVLSDRTVTDVSAGTAHSCAVADGLAFCWGLNTNGRLGNSSTTQSTSPVAVTTSGVLSDRTVTAISSGDTHSCAVADGLAFCWGDNANGRLGDGTTTQRTAPVAVRATGVLNGRALTSISAGAAFSCATGNTPGSCWGLGTGGQLGNEASSTSSVPVDAAVTGPVCADGSVRIGADSCSLIQSTDYYGRLGYSIGTWNAPNSAWIKAATKTRGAVSPAAAARGNTYLDLDWNQVSELEDSYANYTLQRSTSASGANPVTVYDGGLRAARDSGGFPKRTATLAVTEVSAGTDHTCAILEGVAYCWGDNANGELGIGSTTDATVPTAVSTSGVLGGKSVTSISAAMDDGAGNGGQHTCAVADGGVYCWGLNADGELGNGSTTQSTTPVRAGSITGATAIATGYMHSCALVDSKVYCWGDNSRGQIGDGTTTQRNAPVLVQGLLAGKTVTAVAAGAAHTCAVASGVAYCWGSNVSGQLGIGSSGAGTNSSVPVAVRTTGVLNGLTVTAVTAGEAHSCVIASGKAYCWGYNNSGQVGDNSTTLRNAPVAVASVPWVSSASLTSLSAGQYSTCVLANGKAYCWGENGNGQLGNNSTTDRSTPVAVTSSGVLSGTVSQISAGSAHTCAVSGEAASCWGQNSEGRLGTGNTTSSNVPVAVQAVAGAPCAAGATLITPTTCSLTPGTTYYYRVRYVVDGGSFNATSDWVGVKTTS